MASLRAALPVVALVLLLSRSSSAQGAPDEPVPHAPEPLPPPPPPPIQPGPPPPAAPPPPPIQPGPPPPAAPPPQYQPPAAVVNVQSPPVDEDHAPKYSLWTGVRASALVFGFSFYANERGEPETTGNFIKNGFAPQIDVGARISYRYIPYVYWERGFMGAGHRFDGTGASASTDFYGIGFRYLSGDVDSVAFLTDLAIGERVIRVSNGNQQYEMSGLEFFRLGLGAEIRVKTLFALTPLFSLSSGALNDTDGTIDFGCVAKGPCKDGLARPRYTNGQVIDGSRAYVVLTLGMGIHFDLLGK